MEDVNQVESSTVSRAMKLLARPAKIAGSAVLSGMVAYGVTKGIEAYLVTDMIHLGVCETFATAGVAGLGAFVASEAID